MSINKGKTKIRPFSTCPNHGVCCTCPLSTYGREKSKRKQKFTHNPKKK